MDVLAKNLTKRYGDKTILNIDELELKQGVITGVIGPNGSGKSTLMKVIAGLDKEFEGMLQINGQTADQTAYRDMTLVFQKPYLINSDVYHNIAYPLKLRGQTKQQIAEKTEKVIELLQLKAILQQNARTLSGGEGQKVALARAIVFEPKLLLLDEPTANIDPQSMQLMEDAIQYIHQKCRTTIVLVTHNIRQLQRVCHEAVFMREGRTEQRGTVEAVLKSIKGNYLGELLEQELQI